MAYEQDMYRPDMGPANGGGPAAPGNLMGSNPGQIDLDSTIAQLKVSDQPSDLLSIAERKMELHSYMRNWLSSAMMHRREDYEDKWNRWRRNMRNIYDPTKRMQKERWQSIMFVPLSMQNKEIIKSQLYRTLSAGTPVDIKPTTSGSEDEATALKDLIIPQMKRSKYEVASNDFFDDVLTYGTGFMKIFWEKKMARRSKRVPQYAPLDPQSMAAMQQQAASGQPVPPPKPVSYQRMPAELTTVYSGVSAYHVSIWDMFFASDVGAGNIQNVMHAQRYKMTFQEILDGIKQGFFFPEAADALRDVMENLEPTQDKQQEWADLNRTSIRPPKQVNDRNHTVYEAWGPLPKRLAYLRPEEQHLIDNPDELVPCKMLFANECLIDVSENDDYKGESPFLSTGYLHVPGEIYHIGIGEMLEQIQDSINEDTNQRKDNVSLILNRMGAILERAIVSRADLISAPGRWIRIKSNSSDDVTKAVAWMDTPDVTQSSYMETFHQERFAQELTGANRVTIGSGGIGTKDITQTKGGMQILKQSSEDRLIYYAQLIESDFCLAAIKRYYCLIYNNMQPDQVEQFLGPERARYFVPRPPEAIESDYNFSPEGVFTAMHQPIRISQWQAFRDQYRGAPFFDDQAMAQVLAKAIEVPDIEKVIQVMRDPITGKPLPFQMMQQLSTLAQHLAGAPQDPSGGGQSTSDHSKPKIPTKKAGPTEPTAV